MQCAKKLLPSPLKRYLRHKVSLYRYNKLYRQLYIKQGWENIEGQSILLISIPKSGTTYFRLFFANYLNLLFNDSESVITYKMLNERFPNVREYLTFRNYKYIAPHPDILKTPYKDFIYGHGLKFLEFSNARIVALHRNPLDTIVSSFFHRYKNRPDREHLFNEVAESIDAILDGDNYYQGWIERYLTIRKLALDKDNVLRISYEMLWREPLSTLTAVLYYLRIPVNIDVIYEALEYSNINRVHEEEKRLGSIHPVEGFKGYFTRSGKIGQWKQYFTKNHIEYISNKLCDSGIDLEEFVID